MNLLNWTGAGRGVSPYFESNHYRHGALHILKMSDLKINDIGKINLKYYPYIYVEWDSNRPSMCPSSNKRTGRWHCRHCDRLTAIYVVASTISAAGCCRLWSPKLMYWYLFNLYLFISYAIYCPKSYHTAIRL